jgi:hypothetical protein
MLVRTIKSHGHFRWKKQDVFLSEVLWGEPVGLLPVDQDRYTVYFAHVPLALFDARTGKTYRLPRSRRYETEEQEQRQNLPDKKKLSGMCPV